MSMFSMFSIAGYVHGFRFFPSHFEISTLSRNGSVVSRHGPASPSVRASLHFSIASYRRELEPAKTDEG